MAVTSERSSLLAVSTLGTVSGVRSSLWMGASDASQPRSLRTSPRSSAWGR